MSYRQWEIDADQISDDQKASLAYWESLPMQPPLSIPFIDDFELWQLPSAVLPTTHVVDVLDGGKNFHFRFWGSGFRDYLGYDGTGISTQELKPADIAEPVRAAFKTVVENARPFAMISEFQRGATAPIQGFQKFIRLPLAKADGTIGQVVSIVEFQMDDFEARQLISEITAKPT